MSDNSNSQLRAIGIIPARFASSRLPGKPLASIAGKLSLKCYISRLLNLKNILVDNVKKLGKSMIQRTVERARKASQLAALVVATDDQVISVFVCISFKVFLIF